MALAKDLRAASFRGVPFEVDTTSMEAGRRTQLTEYPQRDKPYTEDLGRSARMLDFNGFVVGPDYVAQANRLIGALETPGPGTLIHPWFGTLKVNVKDPARISFDSGLGKATISMSFVESGDLTFPSADNSTQAQSRISAGNIENISVANFASKFSVNGVQDFVTSAAQSNISSVFKFLGGGNVPGLSVLGYATKAINLLPASLSLLSDPTALGLKIANFIGISSYANDGLQWLSLGQSLVRLSSSSSLSSPSAPVVYTPSRQQAYVNNVAVNSLTRQVILAQAVGAASLAPATTYDDSIKLRDNLVAALDQESLTATDHVYDALMDARQKVWRDLTDRSRDSSRLDYVTPLDTTSSLVVAYDYYEDANRSDEIVLRNAIRNPGFVPVQPLKLLTR